MDTQASGELNLIVSNISKITQYNTTVTDFRFSDFLFLCALFAKIIILTVLQRLHQ